MERNSLTSSPGENKLTNGDFTHNTRSKYITIVKELKLRKG